MRQALQPIVFCGYGSNLFPLCDAAQGLGATASVSAKGTASEPGLSAEAAAAATATLSGAKALLPVGNRPLLALALQHVLDAGFDHSVVLAPSWQHVAILRALSHVKLVAAPLSATAGSGKKRQQSASGHASASITFAPRNMTAPAAAATSSSAPHSSPTMHVELLSLGPHDRDGDGSTRGKHFAGDGGETSTQHFRHGRLGTAELLRWVAVSGYLKDADPLVLPVDLVGADFALRDLIDVYVEAQASRVEAPTACCALYERGAGEGLGKERDREGPPRLISALSDDGVSVPHLAFSHDSDISSDMEIRRSLLRASPRTRISTRLLDAHVYIFNRAHIFALLDANPRLTSLRDHVLPLVAKASWQKGLRAKAGWDIGDRRDGRHHSGGRTDMAEDTASRSDEDDAGTQQQRSLASNSMLQEEALARNAARTQSIVRGKNDAIARDDVQCLAFVVRLDDQGADGAQASPGPGQRRRFVARANTLATYIECNRWLLYVLTNKQNGEAGRQDGESIAIPSVEAQPAHLEASQGGVAASAQIAPDTVLGHGVSVGERASVRRSVVGDGCEVGRGAKLNGCILVAGAKVRENARLDNTIVCAGAVVGARCTLADCDVGPGVQVADETSAKHEKLVGSHEDEQEESDDEDESDDDDD